MRGVRITADTELWVPLEPLESGVLTGRMMDKYGNPVSNFTLSVQGESAPSRRLEVTGDEHGKFATAEVPFDRLVFQTHSYPLFRISDVRLEPWAEDVAIVLDLGPYAVQGRVLDEAGFPLAASQVYLSWSHKEGGVRSTAIRQTVTDVDGHFRFAGLGAGLHSISVNIPGQGSARLEKDVSSQEDEVLVQLEPRAL